MELRRTKRFELRLPLRLVRNGNRLIEFLGETQNLSSHGVLFSSNAELEMAEPIEYHISLPSETTPVTLRCLGKVVRMNRGARQTEVAATLERYEFVRE